MLTHFQNSFTDGLISKVPVRK